MHEFVVLRRRRRGYIWILSQFAVVFSSVIHVGDAGQTLSQRFKRTYKTDVNMDAIGPNSLDDASESWMHSSPDVDEDLTHRCTRFVVLTMQRSGSTYMMDRLKHAFGNNLRMGWEAMNTDPSQSGSRLLAQLKLANQSETRETKKNILQNLGAKKWATKVFEHFEEALTADGNCAVGFKMMGPQVDDFSVDDSLELLRDPTVRKLVLFRRNTTAQWFSAQRACWFNDFGSHNRALDQSSETRLLTVERLKRGELCSCSPDYFTKLQTLTTSKAHLYGAWYKALQATEQDWQQISTEELSEGGWLLNVGGLLGLTVRNSSSS